jgi:hypothetical protein
MLYASCFDLDGLATSPYLNMIRCLENQKVVHFEQCLLNGWIRFLQAGVLRAEIAGDVTKGENREIDSESEIKSEPLLCRTVLH